MATSWTVQAEADDSDTWTVDDLSSLDSSAERAAWSMSTALSPNATTSSGFLSWANWAIEELAVNPEDMDLEVEEIQAGDEKWTVVVNEAS